jgi:hypothetical protein
MNKFKVGDSVFVISDAKWAADVLSFGYIGDNIVYRVKNTENTTFTDSFVFEDKLIFDTKKMRTKKIQALLK